MENRNLALASCYLLPNICCFLLYFWGLETLLDVLLTKLSDSLVKRWYKNLCGITIV
uniref:Uncharacterized protein n=1 Tax=Rhizophora mucronata TaxID=61149 RepID=A0A2P2N6N9_RHIMU